MVWLLILTLLGSNGPKILSHKQKFTKDKNKIQKDQNDGVSNSSKSQKDFHKKK